MEAQILQNEPFPGALILACGDEIIAESVFEKYICDCRSIGSRRCIRFPQKIYDIGAFPTCLTAHRYHKMYPFGCTRNNYCNV